MAAVHRALPPCALPGTWHVVHPLTTWPRNSSLRPGNVAQAKKRVAAAKEGWSAVAAGESHRLSTLK